ncbi:MAG: hypothetical protein WC191_10340 [Proteiniphilum sp.]
MNLAEDVVKHLDTSAEAHHESRAEYAGMLIESTLTSQNKILARYAEELTQRDTIIKRQTDEIQGLRRLLDEARGEAQKKSAILEGESEPVIAAKNLRIEELSASVARLEEELARAPAAGDVARLENDVADLRARVQEQDVQVARLETEREGLRDRAALVEGFLHAEMAKSEKILALIPPKKEGFFTRLFRRGD